MNSFFERKLNINEIKGRPVYICGLNVTCIGLIKYLVQMGVSVACISDLFRENISDINDSFFYCRIVRKGTFLKQISEEKIVSPIVFACYENNKDNICACNLVYSINPDANTISINNPYEAYIDVSGTCNLRCRSCQVYNHSPESFNHNNRGNMSFDLFCKILNKILTDMPDVLGIFMFNYGEPLLCPSLPEMIHEIHRRGLVAIISSNLSVKYDFDALIKAEPDIIKISISGFTQDVYSSTHNGGDIELVKRNMLEINTLRKKYGTQTLVFVGYHVYKNNGGTDYDKAKQFCEELDYLFVPKNALFCNIPKKTGIDKYSEIDLDFINNYYINTKKILMHKKQISNESVCRNCIDRLFIDYNGDVFLCFMVMHNDAVFKDYLSTQIDTIRDWQQNHYICNECKRCGYALV